jgi:hypothetical protein
MAKFNLIKGPGLIYCTAPGKTARSRQSFRKRLKSGLLAVKMDKSKRNPGAVR